MAWIADYRQEQGRRKFNLLRTMDDPQLQAALKVYYSTHPIEWIEDWCYTYDPRRPGIKTMPFRLFPKQREFILFLEDCRLHGENGLVEKCRNAGMTWLCVCYSVWLWLFIGGASVGFGSRKEQLVDRLGDPDSIFEKIRFTVRMLPRWQWPEGFSPREHMTFMKLINPANGSNIKGEAGDNIGRGGRSTIYFKDESAHYERPELIEAALGDNTDVQIDISSVNGSANVFYRRRQAGEIWEPNKEIPKGKVRVFVFDWRDDPRRNLEWYNQRRDKAEAEGLLHIFAQEIDRDYSGSIEGIIIRPEWIKACIDAHIVLAGLGNFSAGEHTAGQDVADGGGDTNAYASRHGVVIQRVEDWGGESNDAARHSIPLAIEDNVHEIYYDSIGVGSGFKAEANTMAREGLVPPSMRILPWSAAQEVLDPTDHVIPGDDQSPTNENQYENLKAQSWFRLRTRCWKTYLAITRGKKFDPGELISLPSNIPNIHKLSMEMSQAVKKTAKSGKTLVDKKPDGAKSPNLAESVVMCFNPTREVSGFDVL